MTNLQQNIEQQVGIFVSNISELVRQAAIEALGQAMVIPVEGSGDKQRQKRRKPPENKRQPRKSAPRDPAELSALTERLYEAIATYPGETMTMLASALGCPAKELRVSIGHLVSQGRVKKAGQRQYTRYFPMDVDRE